MIWKRISQLATALSANITEKDMAYVSGLLTDTEQKLFYAMSVPDQKHALRVAYTLERLIAENGIVCDVRLAARVALFHDVGRTGKDMGTSGKVISVLAKAILGERVKKCGKKSLKRKGFRHVIYVHYEHPRIGAAMLRDIGCYREAEVVERHHDKPSDGESVELRLLRIADEAN